MAEWRRLWHRNGLAMMAAAFALWTSHFAVAHAPVWYRNSNWYALGLVLLGGYVAVATTPNGSKVMPWWGRTEARKPGCKVTIDTEFVHDLVRDDIPDEPAYKGCTYIFLTVEVEPSAETGTFTAQFKNMVGFKTIDDTEDVPLGGRRGNIAWENTTQVRDVIGSGASARLILMQVWRDPVVAWFRLPFIEAWGKGTAPRHLTDWRLRRDPGVRRVGCDVVVTNETKQTSGTWRVRFTWRDDGGVINPTATPAS